MKYYHFTPFKNAKSITDNGLIATTKTIRKIDRNYNVFDEIKDVVFLAADIAELKTQINYIYKQPQYIELIAIFEVDSEYLTADKIDYQNKSKVIVYSDNIPATAFTNIWTVSVGIAMLSDFK